MSVTIRSVRYERVDRCRWRASRIQSHPLRTQRRFLSPLSILLLHLRRFPFNSIDTRFPPMHPPRNRPVESSSLGSASSSVQPRDHSRRRRLPARSPSLPPSTQQSPRPYPTSTCRSSLSDSPSTKNFVSSIFTTDSPLPLPLLPPVTCPFHSYIPHHQSTIPTTSSEEKWRVQILDIRPIRRSTPKRKRTTSSLDT